MALWCLVIGSFKLQVTYDEPHLFKVEDVGVAGPLLLHQDVLHREGGEAGAGHGEETAGTAVSWAVLTSPLLRLQRINTSLTTSS